MKGRILLRHLIAAAAAGALLCITLSVSAESQQDQGQNSQGPNPGVNETVLVPKKTPPSSTGSTTARGGSQPATKKPEKINPNEIYTLTTSTNLVNVDVLVVDRNGNPISGFSDLRPVVCQLRACDCPCLRKNEATGGSIQ